MPHYTGDLSRSWVIVPLLVMYLLDLGGVGFLGPDEPRYASIGREMARSGDWITPRLDGEPWFEKPPLLYWMIAAGRRIHLPDEWAARLPVALLSAGFLVFFFRLISREFSSRLALAALAILATSAGWVAFSFAALTDLPIAEVWDITAGEPGEPGILLAYVTGQEARRLTAMSESDRVRVALDQVEQILLASQPADVEEDGDVGRAKPLAQRGAPERRGERGGVHPPLPQRHIGDAVRVQLGHL